MAFVVTEPCLTSKDASCVEVCPVDCIQSDERSRQYFIDPTTCIGCAACVDACPVRAIFAEDEVPLQWQPFVKTNADFFLKRSQADA